MDLNPLIDEARAANEKRGVNIRGKKYTEVAPRIEIFRSYCGTDFGIETEVTHQGYVKGEPVIVRAVIRDKENRVIATGTAWEVIGDGHINASSALENCETSAIGRALACFGIHGGEMASANEIREKTPNTTAEALHDARI